MLPSQIERFFDEAPAHYQEEHFRLFREFKAGLNRGEIRAAEPDPSTKTGWRANPWVKKGILLGFRMGAIVDMSIDPVKQPFFDKSSYPARAFTAAHAAHVCECGRLRGSRHND
jgi:2,3,4,5-tetrahydropyridine-2-carboxylate N-succinyltransferase